MPDDDDPAYTDPDTGECIEGAACPVHCHCTRQTTPCPFHNHDPREDDL